MKGFVYCVVADNLGAHSLAGFVDIFLSKYVCRFCTAENIDIQTTQVKSGAFCLRSKEIHTSHLKAIEENSLDCHFGVKTKCVLSENLSYFSVTESFSPDTAHDLFEGSIPVKIALCLTELNSKKYFTSANLHEAIATFPFKWADLTNRPHLVPLTYATKRTMQGMHTKNGAC